MQDYPSGLLFLDPDRLSAAAAAHRDAYPRARPFPHAVMDDFLPEALAVRLLEEFPARDQIEWTYFEDQEQKKLASRTEQSMGPATRILLYQLNSAPFLEFLEALTGIEGLIPDPYLLGGGLHQIERGGYLEVHADFNWHNKLQLDRRLNLLLYLNRDWTDAFGGHLELWNRDMSSCEQRILPVFNRCVVFSTTDTSFHGHPHPLTCPEGWTRKSLALYYYTRGRPASEDSPEHTTLFQGRDSKSRWKARALRIAGRLTPPVVWDAIRPPRKPRTLTPTDGRRPSQSK